MKPNNGVNLTVRPVTALANGASAAPVRPAGYAERWADMSKKAQEGCPPGQWDRSKIDITKL